MLKQIMANELVQDPTKANWTSQQWLDWFNLDVTSAKKRIILSSELLAWSGENNRFKKIEDVTLNRDHPLYSVCRAALLMIQLESTVLDLNVPARVQMLEALRGNVLDNNDVNTLYAMATIIHPRYVELGVGQPHHGDIVSNMPGDD